MRQSQSIATEPVRRRGLGLAGLTLALTLGGCIPSGEKPDLALTIPGSYRLAPRHAEAAPPALDWWRGFRSRELTGLMEAAQTNNLDIAVAIALIEQADALARVANAALLPTVNGNASVTRSRAPSLTGVTSPDRTTCATSLTASYILDFWGQNRALLLASEESAIVSRYSRDVVALTTLASVANTYFQVLGSQDRLRIARDNLAAATRILNLIRDRERAGTASSLEISQQESVVATQRASIPPLEITLRQSITLLAVLVGRAPEQFTATGGSLNRITTPRLTPGLPSQLLNQRPDIRLAEAQLASTSYNVEAARAAFFPTIQLTGQAGFQSAALSTLFGPGAWFYTAAAALTQPIFDGGRLSGLLDQQKGLQDAALYAYRKSVISAFADVENALVAVQQQTLRERLQTEVVRTSRRAFEISENRLREGTIDLVTLLNTQQTLFAAQDLLSQVQLLRLQAVVSLYQALGGGWPPAEAIHTAGVTGAAGQPTVYPDKGAAPTDDPRRSR